MLGGDPLRLDDPASARIGVDWADGATFAGVRLLNRPHFCNAALFPATCYVRCSCWRGLGRLPLIKDASRRCRGDPGGIRREYERKAKRGVADALARLTPMLTGDGRSAGLPDAVTAGLF